MKQSLLLASLCLSATFYGAPIKAAENLLPPKNSELLLAATEESQVFKIIPHHAVTSTTALPIIGSVVALKTSNTAFRGLTASLLNFVQTHPRLITLLTVIASTTYTLHGYLIHDHSLESEGILFLQKEAANNSSQDAETTDDSDTEDRDRSSSEESSSSHDEAVSSDLTHQDLEDMGFFIFDR